MKNIRRKETSDEVKAKKQKYGWKKSGALIESEEEITENAQNNDAEGQSSNQDMSVEKDNESERLS